MNVAALIIGIDGYDAYTDPLVKSIWRWEPDTRIVIVDNASVEPYPQRPHIHRTDRLCYSAAINYAQAQVAWADWFLVLSNDVLCKAPFHHLLAQLPECVAGPALVQNDEGYRYLEGWCVAVPSSVWRVLGGWDENYQVSSWEDVDFSTTALERGYSLAHVQLPFVHLDQRQRFNIVPDYWDSVTHNMQYFAAKHPHRLEYHA